MQQGQVQNMPPLPQESGTDANLPIGDILRQERERCGWSLAQVEGVLRIKACQLGALESGRLDLLPGRVYAVGFVRTYAECLGLDTGEVVRLFKEQYKADAPLPELHFPVPASESKIPNFRILASSFAVLLAVVVFVVTSMGDGQNKGISAVPFVPALLLETLASEELASGEMYGPPLPDALALAAIEPASGAEDESAVVAAVSVVSPLIIAVIEDTWLEIRNAQGKVLLSRVLRAGDRYTVSESEEGLVLNTGNIAGLSFIIGDKTIILEGKSGDVRRNVPLNAAGLEAFAFAADGDGA